MTISKMADAFRRACISSRPINLDPSTWRSLKLDKKKESNYNQSQTTTQKTNQHTDTSAAKNTQKLNYYGPDYNAIWDENKKGYVVDYATPNITRTQDARNSLQVKRLKDRDAYGTIGPGSQMVQELAGYLDDISNEEINNAFTGNNNTNAARNEYGSSYDANRRANIGEKAGSMKGQNLLNALQSALGTQTQNIANTNALAQGVTTAFDPNSFMQPYARVNTSGVSNALGNLYGTSDTTGKQTTVESGNLLGSMLGLVGSLASLKRKGEGQYSYE